MIKMESFSSYGDMLGDATENVIVDVNAFVAKNNIEKDNILNCNVIVDNKGVATKVTVILCYWV